MRAKRFLTASVFTLLIVIVITVAGMSSAEFADPACACVSVNEVVVWDLNEFDALIQRYATEYGGLFPTYEEFVTLVPATSTGRPLTPQVDLANRAFTFTPNKNDAGKIGYAVSNDRHHYVLLGIGLNIKSKDTYLFGIPIDNQTSGYEMPILHPGDTPPEPSPPA